MSPRIYKSAERHVWIAWLFVAGLVLLLSYGVASHIERQLFPVVDRFDVLSIQQDRGSVKVSGTLIKARECQIVELSAMSEHDSRLKVDYLDRPEGSPPYARPTGASSWGPWRVHHNGARYVILYSEHRCHPFWTVKTPLAAFQVLPRYEP